MSKMKVVLLCQISNSQIRAKLPLSNYGFENLFRKIVGAPSVEYKDVALWNATIIDNLKKNEEIELHVITPHAGLRKKTVEFHDNNVFYHVYQAQLPFPWYLFGKYFQRNKDYNGIRRIVKRWIDSIKPDIVNLIGAENPYYSITALDITDIPVFLHCQTVYANPERIINENKVDMQRWNVELELFQKLQYIACGGRMHYDLIRNYSPNAIIFPRVWPAPKFPTIPEVVKKYDFAYFARGLSKDKGFNNVIEAMGIAVKKNPSLRLIAVGSWDGDKEKFLQRIQELGIENNIEVHPPFPEYTDLLGYVKQARFAVLPIKMDVMSGTILEAMRMGMPVVTNHTSGTPALNKNRETILLSDINDNEGLASNMLALCENEDLAEKLKKNAFLYMKEFDDKISRNTEKMVAQYKAVINHYKKGSPISQELLYNTVENIDYRKK